MSERSVGNNTSNTSGSKSAEAPKTISPAARKFAEYLKRRMVPMIQHAARNNVPEPTDDSEPTRLH
jgi:hypothetical protein